MISLNSCKSIDFLLSGHLTLYQPGSVQHGSSGGWHGHTGKKHVVFRTDSGGNMPLWSSSLRSPSLSVVNSALCVQFSDGVILLLLIGQLEGFFIPLHDFILTPCQSSERVQYRFLISGEPLVMDVHPSERTEIQQQIIIIIVTDSIALCYEAVYSVPLQIVINLFLCH